MLLKKRLNVQFLKILKWIVLDALPLPSDGFAFVSVGFAFVSVGFAFVSVGFALNKAKIWNTYFTINYCGFSNYFRVSFAL